MSENAYHMHSYVSPDEPTAIVGNLDLSKRSDQALLRRSLENPEVSHRQRWPGLDAELRGQAIKAQRQALRLALEKGNVRYIDSCVRTLAMLESQQQTDEHLEDKNKRLDEGKATESQAIQVVYTNRIHAND